MKSCIGVITCRSTKTWVARSNCCTTAGTSFDCKPAFSLLSESSYDPWNTASPTHTVCDALNRFIISAIASPLLPPIECQNANLAAAAGCAGALVAAGAAGGLVGSAVGAAHATTNARVKSRALNSINRFILLLLESRIVLGSIGYAIVFAYKNRRRITSLWNQKHFANCRAAFEERVRVGDIGEWKCFRDGHLQFARAYPRE